MPWLLFLTLAVIGVVTDWSQCPPLTSFVVAVLFVSLYLTFRR